jgi:hypothetical protein
MAIFDIFGASSQPSLVSPMEYMRNARQEAANRSLMNLGFGLMASGAPSYNPGSGSFAGALGSAGLGASQGYQRDLQNSVLGGVGVGQLQKIQSDLDADKAWREQFGVSGAPAAQTPVANVTQAMTPPPGAQAGPTPRAAAGLVGQTTPIETGTGYGMPNLPAGMRSLVGSMGRERGTAFLANMAAKDIERGQFVPENRIIDGKEIQGQKDRLSGKWAPLDPAMTKIALSPNINMPPQEKEEAKVVGKGFGEAYINLQNADLQAPGKVARLDRLSTLLDQVNTGKYAGTVLEMKRTAKAAGIDLDAIGIKDDVAPAQAAQALANEMALELRNPSGGAGMPGAMSDQDREFLKSMIPGIEQTAEGRKLIIDTRKKLAQRDRDVAKLARDYRKKHGSIDEGFFDELAVYSNKNQLFKDMPAPATAAPTPVLRYNPATGKIE